MGIYYDAYLYYGIVKKAKDFEEADIEEYGIYEMVLELASKGKGLDATMLGHDEQDEAVVGKCLGKASCGEGAKISLLDSKEIAEIDIMLGATGEYIVVQGVS